MRQEDTGRRDLETVGMRDHRHLLITEVVLNCPIDFKLLRGLDRSVVRSSDNTQTSDSYSPSFTCDADTSTLPQFSRRDRVMLIDGMDATELQLTTPASITRYAKHKNSVCLTISHGSLSWQGFAEPPLSDHECFCKTLRFTNCESGIENLVLDKQGLVRISEIRLDSISHKIGLPLGWVVHKINSETVNAMSFQASFISANLSGDLELHVYSVEENQNMWTIYSHSNLERCKHNLHCRTTPSSKIECSPASSSLPFSSSFEYYLCEIHNKNVLTSYGFSLVYLRSGDHVIQTLDHRGVAYIAGLQNGDRLVEVNGKSLQNLCHQRVVDLLKDAMYSESNPISLLVVRRRQIQHGVGSCQSATSDRIKRQICGRHPGENASSLPENSNGVSCDLGKPNYFGLGEENHIWFPSDDIVIIHAPTQDIRPTTIPTVSNSHRTDPSNSDVQSDDFAKRFGFDFITGSQNQHIVTHVFDNCPLGQLGLKSSDQILYLNNVNTQQLDHVTMKSMIQKLSGEKLVMTVVSGNCRSLLCKYDFPIVTTKFITIGECWQDKITLKIATIAFGQHYVHKISNVMPTEVSKQLNICSNDVLIAIDGEDTSQLDEHSLSDRIKQALQKPQWTLMLSTHSTSSQNLLSAENHETTIYSSHDVKTIKFRGTHEGIGFCLDFKKPLPVVCHLDPNSKAFLEGLRNGMQIVSINGIDIIDLKPSIIIKQFFLDVSEQWFTLKVVKTQEHGRDMNTPSSHYLNRNMGSLHEDKHLWDAYFASKSKSMMDLSLDGLNKTLRTKTGCSPTTVSKITREANSELMHRLSLNQEYNTKEYSVDVSSKSELGMTIVRHRDGTVTLESIKSGSLAFKAGLRENDFLVKINNIPVKIIGSCDKVVERIRNLCINNNAISMEVIRKRQSWIASKSISDLTKLENTRPVPRRCTLRLNDESSWGFELEPLPSLDCPQVVQVSLHSPAHRAGLCNNDMILAIDKISVQTKDQQWPWQHSRAALAKRHMECLVLTEQAYWVYKRHGGVIREEDMNIFDYEHPPMYCFIRYAPRLTIFRGRNVKKGVGITIKEKEPTVISSIDKTSPAHRARLKKNDIIVEIDDAKINTLMYDQISELIAKSKSSGCLKILVVDYQTDNFYKSKCIPLNSYVNFASVVTIDK